MENIWALEHINNKLEIEHIYNLGKRLEKRNKHWND
jgi:hypothetical protein